MQMTSEVNPCAPIITQIQQIPEEQQIAMLCLMYWYSDIAGSGNPLYTWRDVTWHLWRFLLDFCPVFCILSICIHIIGIFWKEIGPSLLFLTAGTTNTKVRRFTGVATANSTNIPMMSWVGRSTTRRVEYYWDKKTGIGLLRNTNTNTYPNDLRSLSFCIQIQQIPAKWNFTGRVKLQLVFYETNRQWTYLAFDCFFLLLLLMMMELSMIMISWSSRWWWG